MADPIQDPKQVSHTSAERGEAPQVVPSKASVQVSSNVDDAFMKKWARDLAAKEHLDKFAGAPWKHEESTLKALRKIYGADDAAMSNIRLNSDTGNIEVTNKNNIVVGLYTRGGDGFHPKVDDARVKPDSQLDLVKQHGDAIQAFAVKWSSALNASGPGFVNGAKHALIELTTSGSVKEDLLNAFDLKSTGSVSVNEFLTPSRVLFGNNGHGIEVRGVDSKGEKQNYLLLIKYNGANASADRPLIYAVNAKSL